MAKPQFLIRIGYKTGQVEEFWFDKFKFNRVEGTDDVAGIECIFSDPNQTNFMFGLTNIAYVYQVAVRMVEGDVIEEAQ
ncbi:hypothetical protein PMW_17 [Pseudomonas phage phiPMW]|uniref:Uncharacterized protein n=1 Tax=Pseudomonas phage phiPMW TaxID=1815582 RepID=A0A1S5R154_9CAUD|nr:hypothetical protein FDG97_gp017 [Pseudomonas phage phiPMW]ANA49142.1 hypothetical protein PMW_17 [Pseudomonas phage phiPMW]